MAAPPSPEHSSPIGRRDGTGELFCDVINQRIQGVCRNVAIFEMEELAGDLLAQEWEGRQASALVASMPGQVLRLTSPRAARRILCLLIRSGHGRNPRTTGLRYGMTRCKNQNHPGDGSTGWTPGSLAMDPMQPYQTRLRDETRWCFVRQTMTGVHRPRK